MARTGAGLAWVLCEWHTDYVLGWNDGARSVVSVKHREADSGFWTIARLFSDGGMGTLYQRWAEGGRPAESRWVTNGGLDIDCRKLLNACASDDRDSLQTLAVDLAPRFAVTEDEVLAFLRTLRISNDTPSARHIRTVDIDDFARPTLSDLGLAIEAAADAYDAVVELVRAAARAAGSVCPSVWLLSALGSLDAAAQIRADVSRRMIRRQHVIAALRQAAVPAASALPAGGVPTTRLTRKLRAGDVVPTAVAAARRARRAWTEYERGVTPPLPGYGSGPDFRALRTVLTAEAAEAQRLARERGEPYGDRMLADIHNRVAMVARDLAPVHAIDARLLMGLTYDLTAQCEIWWSPQFEIEEQ